MNKRNVFLLVFFVFLAHSSSLGNGLIGDDRALFEQNDFYHSFHNLPRLVQKDFITQFSDIDPSASGLRSLSGCVSYRPVTALSFFFDYFFWKTQAWGYHLDNILLHILVCLCLYYFVIQAAKREGTAFLAALLFGLHPVHCEVVNSIGYRSDILSALFLLIAFIFFMRHRENQKKPFFSLSVGSFFIALLAKESAIVFLPLMILYDFIFSAKDKKAEFLYKKKFEYAGYFTVLLFYACLYFVVFPNANSGLLFQGGAHLAGKLATMGSIFFQYVSVLINPFNITVLPPLYLPFETEGQGLFYFYAALFSFLICGYLAYRKSKVALFFILWILIAYLPVSNIILLPNPFAFRFMYLPSIGFFVLLSLGMHALSGKLYGKAKSSRQGAALGFLLAGLLLSVTFPFHMYFKNDIVACQAMIRRYPDSSRPYFILGQEYLKQGRYREAAYYFRKYLAQDIRNPYVSVMNQDYFARYQLGLCFPDDPVAAAKEFKESIGLNPDFVMPYLQMARICILQEKYTQALDYAAKAVDKKPDFALGYVYVIHSYVFLKDTEKAEDWLGRVMRIAPQDPNVIYVKNLVKDSASKR